MAKEGPCKVCGRASGERRPRCIRCGDRPALRQLPHALPGRYLVVDAGRTSGWAIVERGEWGRGDDGPVLALESGETDLWTTEPARVVDRARAQDCEALIYEQPNVGGGIGHMPPATMLGFGKPVGVWEWLWRTTRRASASAAPGHRSVILSIPSMTWRATVIGGPQRPSEQWKADAQRHARQAFPSLVVGADLADALCLAEHALCSLDVADAVGPQRLRKLGWTEPRGCWVEGRFIPAEGTR